jgi:trk system potassium uptake protein
MKIIIVGGGETGLTVANLLGDQHEITIIEKDAEKTKAVSQKTHALIIHGDGSDISVLQEAGLESTDVIISTSDDKTNLMVCTIGKSENVKKIISLVNYPKNEELFTKLGITNVVSVVGTNVTAIKGMLYQLGDARIIAQLGQGEMQIVEQIIEEESTLIGKPPKLQNATLAAIYRSGELILPSDQITLQKGDVLLVVVKTSDLPNLSNLISGK